MFADIRFTQVAPTTAAPTPTSADPAKAKKGKLNAKSTGLTYQFQIMESIGQYINVYLPPCC